MLAQVVLVAPDFPSGWTGTPTPARPAANSGQSQLVACVGGKNTSPDKTASVDSDRFTSGTSTISSSATRYKSAADIAADVALLQSSKILACYKSLTLRSLQASLPAGTKVVSADLKVVPAPAGAPANVVAVATGKIVVTTSGQSVSVYQTRAFVTGRLVEAEVDFQGIGAAVPAAVQEQLIDVVAGRVAQI